MPARLWTVDVRLKGRSSTAAPVQSELFPDAPLRFPCSDSPSAEAMYLGAAVCVAGKPTLGRHLDIDGRAGSSVDLAPTRGTASGRSAASRREQPHRRHAALWASSDVGWWSCRGRAAIEEKFWRNCCDAIDLPVELRAPKADPGTVKAAIAERLGAKTVAHWREAFQGEDFSVEAVADLAAARAVHTRRARCLRPRRSHGERRGVSGPSATAGSRITLARHTLRARVRRAGARGEAVGRDRDRPSDRRRMRTR